MANYAVKVNCKINNVHWFNIGLFGIARSGGVLAVKADCRSNPSSWSLLDTSQMHEVPTTDDCTHFLAKGGLTVRTYVQDSSQPNEKVQQIYRVSRL